ncbi:pyridoxal-dependent decarboxylase [Flavobacterium antarcticum]|uniref:pyridoxal phosphate-dependent decarboxylase family protein n=1 Tax=Flavobacterium antarcticum TaxID=271155 RepID=UPI00041AD110|nr:pyridoxal-dependent decarboxylase [Flavobacterium antarcticum]
MQYWKKLSQQERVNRIAEALQKNVNFSKDTSLGYPASKLDNRVFYDDAPFLKDAPTLQAYVANPNNIGCHTFGTSEKAFAGTQNIEREVLNVIAVDIFKAQPDGFDGYISPGGTEANIQAFWIYRNQYIKDFNARLDEIVLVASEDTHYSIAKASNLLMIDSIKIPVNFDNRTISKEVFENHILEAKKKGKKYFIVTANMGTTMFGAVDDVNLLTDVLVENNIIFKLHIDGAYGGFFYPFSNPDSVLNFENPHVSSITIDAHKMLQAPYGTGIFICRKGLIENVLTKEAEYVEGMDLTLCGSRSGANAVAVWMILFTYGGNGWFEKISILQMRTKWFCKELDALGIAYFRNPFMNIVTLKASYIPEHLAERFDLVPQKHDHTNQWYKVIMMEHVEIEHLTLLIDELKQVIVL